MNIMPRDKFNHKKYNQEWRKRNPEKVAEYNLRRREKYKLNPPSLKPKTEKQLVYNREYNKTNRERLNAYRRERYAFSSDSNRNQSYKKRYGISLEDYNKMLVEQNGVCAICFQEPKVRRLAVDHNHNTGQVRGLLCHHCNTSLGSFNDDKSLLLSAVKYLDKWDK